MKIDKRFQLLLTEDELEQIKDESNRRGISSAELIRIAIRKELSQNSVSERRKSIQALTEWEEE